MGPQRLFPWPLGAHCVDCQLLELCGAERSDDACPPRLDLRGVAGPFVLHPARADFKEHFARVGGVAFDDILPAATEHLDLPAHLPQVRWLARLRAEQISSDDFGVVAVRLEEVFRHGRVRTCHELRAKTGLAEDVDVVLLLHARDELLEELWGGDFAPAIAGAGYALVTPPSFSVWRPQRRPDNLLSLRRSMLYYAALRDAGANVCLRVAWTDPMDVKRLADFVTEHEVSLVSLDLMTFRERSLDQAIALLTQFDALTDARCHYLVDGVRARSSIEKLYLAASPARVTVSDASFARPPPETNRGMVDTLGARAAIVRARCKEASKAVEALASQSVERFIDETTREQKRSLAGAHTS